MACFNFVTLLVIVVPAASGELGKFAFGPLSKELHAEGLVEQDARGFPVTTCLVTGDDQVTRVETCSIPADTSYLYPQSVGCYSVWRSGFLRQGCWVSQELALKTQCDKRSCLSRRSVMDVHFCCCHGPQCNAEFMAL